MDPEGGPDDGSIRDQAVRNALTQVPSHRLLAVIEDSCTYLLESLKDITDASLAAGTYAYMLCILNLIMITIISLLQSLTYYHPYHYSIVILTIIT